MTHTRRAVALAAVFVSIAVSHADDKPADKLLGRWALPGKAKLRWEFYPDGTVTGTANGKPVFHQTASTGPHLHYAMGATDDEGNVELTLTLRPTEKSAGEGVYKAKVEFTRQGRITLKYIQKPTDLEHFPPPFPEGKKLYRPEDVSD